MRTKTPRSNVVTVNVFTRDETGHGKFSISSCGETVGDALARAFGLLKATYESGTDSEDVGEVAGDACDNGQPKNCS